MKRKKNPLRFRKRAAASTAGYSQFQSIQEQLQGGDYPGALSAINDLLPLVTDIDSKTELLSLAADCLFLQGKYAEAADAFAHIGDLVQGQPLLWARPAIGQIHSLLKNVQVEAAQTRTLAAMQTAVAFYQQYQTQLAQAVVTIAAGGQATVPAEPPKPANVAARFGKIFFGEGEVAVAKSLFQQSLQLDASNIKALLGLAEIAVRENDSATAIAKAKTALAVNHYHAETLYAWKLLLDAGRKSGTNVLDAALLNNLSQSPAGVRGRATLIIVKNLRGQGDARWQTISNDWLQIPGAKDKVIVAELRKLNLAHARITNPGHAARRQLAQAVLNTPGISPGEWLAATKQVVSTKLAQNQSPNLDALITDGATTFGTTFRPQFTHGLALACQKAGRADLATTLFQQNATNSNATAEQKGKSLWALARLQSGNGDHAGAAQSYLALNQNQNTPQRFQTFALVQWLREIIAANQPDLIATAKPKILAALPQITDYELTLDLARQVLALKWNRELAFTIFAKGKTLAIQAFDAAGHPNEAAGILFKYCRRASGDFWQMDETLVTWNRLTDEKRQWLWSENQDYWNYLELVYRAYRDKNQFDQATQFVTPLLADPATPPGGYAILGISFAIQRRVQKDFAAMFSLYEKVAQIAPMHEATTSAYYWLALRAWKNGDTAKANTNADKLQQALSGDTVLYWKRDYAAAVICLKAGLNAQSLVSQPGFSVADLKTQLATVQSDLALLNG